MSGEPNSIKMVQATLSDKPRRADMIAQDTGLKIEDVYHSLVWLYDRNQAHMDRSNRKDRRGVEGWTK